MPRLEPANIRWLTYYVNLYQSFIMSYNLVASVVEKIRFLYYLDRVYNVLVF